MNDIEATVREVLRARVDAPPPLDGLTERAIGGAQRVRQRRYLAGAGAVAIAVLAAFAMGAGLPSDNHHRPGPGPVGSGEASPTEAPPSGVAPSPSASAWRPPSGMAVVVNGTAGSGGNARRRSQLIIPGSRTFSLDAIPGGVTNVYSTRDGWLLDGYGDQGAGDQSLWLATRRGELRPLVAKAEGSVAISADGRRFAWRSGNTLSLGRLTTSATIVTEHRAVIKDPAGGDLSGHPLGIVGDSVLLGKTYTGGGIDAYDIWNVRQSAHVPSWISAGSSAVGSPFELFGPAPDGRSFLGSVRGPGDNETCLALLDPQSRLRATKTACGVELPSENSAPVSPDGERIAFAVMATGSGDIAVHESASIFTRPEPTTIWRGTGHPRSMSWVDSTTLITVDDAHQLTRYRIGEDPERVTLPGLADVEYGQWADALIVSQALIR